MTGWRLALAVAGLVLGLIGMHHVLLTGTTPQAAVVELVSVTTDAAVSEPGHGSTVDAPMSDRHSDHLANVLHLCLAVLFGALAIVIALFLVRGGGDGPSRIVSMTRPSAGGSPAPPPTASRRLALLGVLRT